MKNFLLFITFATTLFASQDSDFETKLSEILTSCPLFFVGEETTRNPKLIILDDIHYGLLKIMRTHKFKKFAPEIEGRLTFAHLIQSPKQDEIRGYAEETLSFFQQLVNLQKELPNLQSQRDFINNFVNPTFYFFMDSALLTMLSAERLSHSWKSVSENIQVWLDIIDLNLQKKCTSTHDSSDFLSFTALLHPLVCHKISHAIRSMSDLEKKSSTSTCMTREEKINLASLFQNKVDSFLKRNPCFAESLSHPCAVFSNLVSGNKDSSS